MGQLLQIRATVITNWGQTLLQIRAAITNRGNYYKLGHNKQQCIKKNNVKTQKQSENWTCDMLSKTSV